MRAELTILPPVDAARRALLGAAGMATLGTATLSAVPRLVRAQPFDSIVLESSTSRWRELRANGIADHPIGGFPNPHCPSPVRPQRHRYRMALAPQPAAQATAIGYWEFGVALNGVPLDPAGPHFRGDPDSGWQFEVMAARLQRLFGLDANFAHVQPHGAYHYHALAPVLLERAQSRGGMMQLGWAADGFAVYAPLDPALAAAAGGPRALLRPSYRLRSGRRSGGPGGNHDGTFVEDYEYVAGLGDLDQHNGRTGVTPEFPQGTYYYVLTTAFPFIPRSWRGTPDRSFAHAGGPGLGDMPRELQHWQG